MSALKPFIIGAVLGLVPAAGVAELVPCDGCEEPPGEVEPVAFQLAPDQLQLVLPGVRDGGAD